MSELKLPLLIGPLSEKPYPTWRYDVMMYVTQKILPQTFKNFAQIYLPCLWHYATLEIVNPKVIAGLAHLHWTDLKALMHFLKATKHLPDARTCFQPTGCLVRVSCAELSNLNFYKHWSIYEPTQRFTSQWFSFRISLPSGWLPNEKNVNLSAWQVFLKVSKKIL